MHQLNFSDELKRQDCQKQARCRHQYIFIPIAFDEKQDEVYEAQVCKKCGKYNS